MTGRALAAVAAMAAALTIAPTVRAQDNGGWQTLQTADGAPVLEYRTDTWTTREVPEDLGAKPTTFPYVAVRAHLDHFELTLTSVELLAQSLRAEAATRALRADSKSLTGLGLVDIVEALREERGTPPVALVGAGFPSSVGGFDNFGLLKVRGNEVAPYHPSGPSAVFCLHSGDPRYRGYVYQVPAFYRPQEDKAQFGRVDDCADAVQVGPRVLEDPLARIADAETRVFAGGEGNATVTLGINAEETTRTAYPRTVVAVDWPRRRLAAADGRTGGRNIYLLVVPDPVHLWDVQDLLISPEFYGDTGLYPWWAINMVGGVYAGIVIPELAAKDVTLLEAKGQLPGTAGNIDIVQSAVIAIVPR